MWGFKNYLDRKLSNWLFLILTDRGITELYNKNGNSPKGSDQDFLATYIWPIAKKNATIHASYFCNSFGAITTPFPTKRPVYNCFVPCAYCCSKSLQNKIWTDECPPKCRPKEHQDWIYC
jgi:hypothetical protein